MESARKFSIRLFDFRFLRSVTYTQNLVPISRDERLFNLFHFFRNQNRWSFERRRSGNGQPHQSAEKVGIRSEMLLHKGIVQILVQPEYDSSFGIGFPHADQKFMIAGFDCFKEQ